MPTFLSFSLVFCDSSYGVRVIFFLSCKVHILIKWVYDPILSFYFTNIWVTYLMTITDKIQNHQCTEIIFSKGNKRYLTKIFYLIPFWGEALFTNTTWTFILMHYPPTKIYMLFVCYCLYLLVQFNTYVYPYDSHVGGLKCVLSCTGDEACADGTRAASDSIIFQMICISFKWKYFIVNILNLKYCL